MFNTILITNIKPILTASIKSKMLFDAGPPFPSRVRVYSRIEARVRFFHFSALEGRRRSPTAQRQRTTTARVHGRNGRTDGANASDDDDDGFDDDVYDAQRDACRRATDDDDDDANDDSGEGRRPRKSAARVLFGRRDRVVVHGGAYDDGEGGGGGG